MHARIWSCNTLCCFAALFRHFSAVPRLNSSCCRPVFHFLCLLLRNSQSRYVYMYSVLGWSNFGSF